MYGLEQRGEGLGLQRTWSSSVLREDGGGQQRTGCKRERPTSLRCRLEDWALPHPVVAAFNEKGVKQMYPWQAAAVEEGRAGDNLVFSAPTSGGKSLVAEVLLVRRLVEVRRRMMLMAQPVGGRRRRKPRPRALLVLPYISIVSEKVAHLQEVLSPMGLKVKGYAGLETTQPIAEAGEDIAICTIEKANAAVNRLILEGRIAQLACVVVDEMHMISDPNRGVMLELTITKILYAERKAGRRACQIIAMSATMRGLQALSRWLNARLFVTNYRPVPLTEHAVFQKEVFEKYDSALPVDEEGSGVLQAVRKLAEVRAPGRRADDDTDGMVQLVAEVVAEGHSALVFCQSRKQCQNCAARLVTLLPQVVWGTKGAEWPPPKAMEQRALLCERLLGDTEGNPDPDLMSVLSSGIAFHHAGLTAEEREVVEAGYRAGTVQVITATSTLAAGVNLPARRVILRGLQQGIGNVSRAQYLQMVGRAGRAGQCDYGESFIIGKGGVGQLEWGLINQLLAEPLPEMRSQLIAGENLKASSSDRDTYRPSGQTCAGSVRQGSPALERLLLESVANGSVSSAEDVKELLCSTLAAEQGDFFGAELKEQTKAALQKLHKDKLMNWESSLSMGQARDTERAATISQAAGRWCVTRTGLAVHNSALPTPQGKLMYAELEAVRKDVCLVDGGVLHLVFILLGCQGDGGLIGFKDWSAWRQCLSSLLARSQHESAHYLVASKVGVTEEFAMSMCRLCSKASSEERSRHARFFTSLILSDLLSECGLPATMEKWGRVAREGGMSRGQLQKMQTDLAKSAAMAAQLAASASWWSLESLLNSLSAQAAAGTKPELLPLMKVPTVTALQARSLFNHGIKTPQMLAEASPEVLQKALVGAAPSDRHRKQPAPTGRGRGRGRGGRSTVTLNALGSTAAVERLAASLPKLAWQHLLDEANKAAQAVVAVADDEEEKTEQGAKGGALMAPDVEFRREGRRDVQDRPLLTSAVAGNAAEGARVEAVVTRPREAQLRSVAVSLPFSSK